MRNKHWDLVVLNVYWIVYVYQRERKCVSALKVYFISFDVCIFCIFNDQVEV
jgi:hypothetical protein